MIELEGLTKRFGAKTAVDHLSFQVRPGVVTGFLGPNGAGKSTTMRMMLDLDNPTSGTVRIDGKHYRDLPEPLKYIGALLDAKAMNGGRSAYNNLLCLAQSNRIPERRVSEVLDLVGLTAVAKKKSKGFSLGMGQRLGIASALLGDPEILMFDEPVNGLDPEGILWIRNLMKGLAAEGRTIFVSSHLMSEMALTADHLVVIGQGRLLADLSMADFIQQNSRSYVRLRSPQQERLKDVLHEAGIDADQRPGHRRTGDRRRGVGAARRAGRPAPDRAARTQPAAGFTGGSVHAHDGGLRRVPRPRTGGAGIPPGPGMAADNPARPADVPAWGAGFEATRKGGE